MRQPRAVRQLDCEGPLRAHRRADDGPVLLEQLVLRGRRVGATLVHPEPAGGTLPRHGLQRVYAVDFGDHRARLKTFSLRLGAGGHAGDDNAAAGELPAQAGHAGQRDAEAAADVLEAQRLTEPVTLGRSLGHI